MNTDKITRIRIGGHTIGIIGLDAALKAKIHGGNSLKTKNRIMVKGGMIPLVYERRKKNAY
jgi:hypothetical protein